MYMHQMKKYICTSEEHNSIYHKKAEHILATYLRPKSANKQRTNVQILTNKSPTGFKCSEIHQHRTKESQS